MPRPSTRLLPLFLLCLACAPADPKALTDRGNAALGSGDAAEALENFETALAHIDPSHPDWLRASIGRCQALARRDPQAAKREFLAIAKAQPARVQAQDFSIIVGELVQHGAIVEAVDVMDVGVKLYPESPQMQAIKEQVLAASAKAKDPEVLKKLKGLGYVGGDQ